jgi:hypothetical protein
MRDLKVWAVFGRASHQWQPLLITCTIPLMTRRSLTRACPAHPWANAARFAATVHRSAKINWIACTINVPAEGLTPRRLASRIGAGSGLPGKFKPFGVESGGGGVDALAEPGEFQNGRAVLAGGCDGGLDACVPLLRSRHIQMMMISSAALSPSSRLQAQQRTCALRIALSESGQSDMK